MSDDKPTKGYLIGYARPPAEHRFAKGRSGNPAGRPPGRKKAKAPNGRFDFGLAPTRALILEEAYRPITLREGDQVLTLPTIQAVMRAMAVQAVKGNRLAQKNLTDLVHKIETGDSHLRHAQFKSAVEYKDSWEAEFRRCDAAGLPRPEPIPHPHDIELLVDTAGVRYRGPLTASDKEVFEEGLRHAAVVVEVNRKLHRQLRRAPGDNKLQQMLAENQRIVDELNRVLTPRYRKRVFGDG